MACDGYNWYFSFLGNFLPFYPHPPPLPPPLTDQKIKISKKWKKRLEISSFNTSVSKIMIICFTVAEIRHVTDVIVIFHFGLFSALLTPPPSSPKNKYFKKKRKKHPEISPFYTTVPKIMIICSTVQWCSLTFWALPQSGEWNRTFWDF